MGRRTIVVTGGAGFTGSSVVRILSNYGYRVYALIRPGSDHNSRLACINNVIPIELDMDNIISIGEHVESEPEIMIHLFWESDRYNMNSQYKNIKWTLDALDAAAAMGCKRFVCAGSQAEYGSTLRVQKEDMTPNPFCAYGAAKVSACYLSRYRAKEIGIEWLWGRIFSLYGTNEPDTRMLSNIVKRFANNEEIHLSSCRQNWDYLHVKDGARAIITLAEKGKDGEIYNIANGTYRPLMDYVEEAKHVIGSDSEIFYGSDPEPYVSLQPSVEKIMNDTGWNPEISFAEGIKMGF